MFQSIGLVGAGRVAHILLGGWQRAGTHLPIVHVFDPAPEAVAALQAAFPAIRAASLETVAQQHLVFVGAHPPAMAELLPRLAPQLRADAVVVSLAPKLRLPALREKLGGFARLARLNPNAPAIVGQGFNPIAYAAELPDDARRDVLELLAPLGQSPRVEDELIEACAAISAMGPTYFWFQFDTLRRLAEEFGMSEDLARQAVRSMLHGAVETLFDSGLAAERVMDLVPVRPLAEDEAGIRAILRERVGGIHRKLTA